MSPFVKSDPSAPAGMYPAEARGLEQLAATGALRTPRVLAVDDRHIALERLGGAPGPRFDEQLGRGLAALHRTSASAFGDAHDNFIALLPQANGWSPSWPTFYADRRLRPMAELAFARGGLDRTALAAIDTLAGKLSELVGPSEPPALLHGDLWSGNVMADETGAPVLIDPSVYAGHREVDLAMMRLFGGFSASVYAAYAETFPLAPGAAERVALYQLYPLLVHAALFGGTYGSRAFTVCRSFL